MPFLSIFAAYSLHWGWEKIKERQYRALMLSVFLLIGFSLFAGKNVQWLTAQNRFYVLYNEALDATDRGEYDSAIIKYKEALTVGLAAEAYTGLGDVLIKKKLYVAAISELKKAMALDPNQVPTYSLLGTAYTELDRLDEGISAFYRSLELDSSRFYPYAGLAIAFEKKGMAAKAVECWIEYLKRDPDGQWSNLARAKIGAKT